MSDGPDADEYAASKKYRGHMERVLYNDNWFVTFDGEMFYHVNGRPQLSNIKATAREIADIFPHATRAFFTIRCLEIDTVVSNLKMAATPARK